MMIPLSVSTKTNIQSINSAVPAGIDLVRARSLYQRSEGDSKVTVALIDGPVDMNHPDLVNATIRQIGEMPSHCSVPNSLACRHGTFVVGMLLSPRDSETPGLCPGCSFLIRPIFCEAGPGIICPVINSGDLADALHESIDAGAQIVNMSLGIESSAIKPHPELDDAAHKAGVELFLLCRGSCVGGRAFLIALFFPSR